MLLRSSVVQCLKTLLEKLVLQCWKELLKISIVHQRLDTYFQGRTHRLLGMDGTEEHNRMYKIRGCHWYDWRQYNLWMIRMDVRWLKMLPKYEVVHWAKIHPKSWVFHSLEMLLRSSVVQCLKTLLEKLVLQCWKELLKISIVHQRLDTYFQGRTHRLLGMDGTEEHNRMYKIRGCHWYDWRQYNLRPCCLRGNHTQRARRIRKIHHMTKERGRRHNQSHRRDNSTKKHPRNL